MTALLLSACQSDKSPIKLPTEVTEYVVEPRTIPATFDSMGFAESVHPVEIRARVEGYLDQIAYQEGQLVHEGELMFQLDPKQFKAEVEKARGEVARQKALLENAKLTLDRLTPLYQQKATSKKDLDNAIANKLAIEAALISAEAQLMVNEINLGYTTITSPITGLADRSRYRQGALINPGSNSLMTTVSVLDPIWVYFPISDNDILRIRHEQKNEQLILPNPSDYVVEAILSDSTPYAHLGKVDFTSPTYDQSTGTMMARAVFPNPDAHIRPGQFVRIKVSGATRPNALAVPLKALMQKSSGLFVYLITADSKVIAQDVSIGEWDGDFQIITNGLKPGDRVIVDGINKVRPGMEVRVK